MELLRKQHECKKFYEAINMARKQFKPRVHTCRNDDGSLKVTNRRQLTDVQDTMTNYQTEG